MTRQVQDGMGIVEVPGQAGVGIYYDNRLVTHTDASGRAVVTGLRPYERNHISIDTSRMPIGTGISASDVVVVPRYRGAAQVLFDARAGRSATIRLVTPSGDPIRAGATVRVDGQARGFVGYDGDTYLVDIAAGMALDVDRGGTTCRAVLPPLGDDPLARIGPLPCKPVEANP
jgi:outer membrane usher protein